MRRSWLGIANLMGVVAIAALNLGVGRFLATRRDESIFIGLVPMAILLQGASWFAWRGRGRVRTFSRGFVAGGLLVWLSLVWAIVFIAVQNGRPYSQPARLPGVWVYAAWDYYGTGADALLGLWRWLRRIQRSSQLARSAVEAVVWFAPQLIGALVGGNVAARVARRLQRQHPPVAVVGSPQGERADRPLAS